MLKIKTLIISLCSLIISDSVAVEIFAIGQPCAKIFHKVRCATFLRHGVCDHNPPTSQTDRQTTCDRKTALCTEVHRAVKTSRNARHSLGWTAGVASRYSLRDSICLLLY